MTYPATSFLIVGNRRTRRGRRGRRSSSASLSSSYRTRSREPISTRLLAPTGFHGSSIASYGRKWGGCCSRHSATRCAVASFLAIWIGEHLIVMRALASQDTGAVLLTDDDAAYDRTSRDWLLRVAKRVVDPRLHQTISMLTASGSTRLMLEALSRPITVARGVPQGLPLSPSLYNLACEPLLAALRKANFRTRGAFWLLRACASRLSVLPISERLAPRLARPSCRSSFLMARPERRGSAHGSR